jgi:hypothetical protein
VRLALVRQLLETSSGWLGEPFDRVDGERELVERVSAVGAFPP